jgi:xanthine/uracil permease
MGQARQGSVRAADLLRTTGEPRWAALVDGLLAAIVVVWILVLSFLDPGHTLRLAVPLVLAAGVVWRVFLLVESSQRSQTLELAEAPQPEIDTASPGPAQAA